MRVEKTEKDRRAESHKLYFDTINCDDLLSTRLIRGSKAVKASLESLLGKLTALPLIILQGEFNPSAFQNSIMANIWLQPMQVTQVLPILALLADSIIVRQIDVENQFIQSLGIVASLVETTSEANLSYSAVVVLYSVFLAS